jgi:hypothetical protein
VLRSYGCDSVGSLGSVLSCSRLPFLLLNLSIPYTGGAQHATGQGGHPVDHGGSGGGAKPAEGRRRRLSLAAGAGVRLRGLLAAHGKISCQHTQHLFNQTITKLHPQALVFAWVLSISFYMRSVLVKKWHAKKRLGYAYKVRCLLAVVYCCCVLLLCIVVMYCCCCVPCWLRSGTPRSGWAMLTR